jgi:hypothetical protein
MTEKEVADELLKLLRRPPKTKAEKKFYDWVVAWKATLEERKTTL